MRPILLLIVACSGDGTPGTTPEDSGPAPACWEDLPVGEVQTLATGFADGTEGISFVEGRLLVSGGGGLFEVGADGTVETIAELPSALGLAPASGSVLLADPGEFTFDGSGDDGRLLRVRLSGEVEVLAEGMPNPNFVARAPWGEILVSDDTGDVIYAVSSSGEVRPWLSGLPSSNGMAFSADGATLYVASTFVADAPVWAVPVSADGQPGEPVVLAHASAGAALDGLALDAEGSVWVAANLANEIWRIDAGTGEAAAFATGLRTPASLAFGQGESFDPCSIYYTELFGEEVKRLSVGLSGLSPLSE